MHPAAPRGAWRLAAVCALLLACYVGTGLAVPRKLTGGCIPGVGCFGCTPQVTKPFKL